MEFLRNIDPVWLSLGPVLVINIILLSSLFYFMVTRKGRLVPDEVATRHNSKFLSGALKQWWYWNIDPISKFFIRLKMTPNILTFIGFILSGVAAFFYSKGLFGFAGWSMLLGGTFDLFDGQVARLTGKVSKSGAFFDSVMDRFSEGLVFLGLAYYFRDSWLLGFIIAGAVGSMMVSYTRARGEAVGVVVKKGSMQRPERFVYLGCASVFEPMTSYGLGFFWSNPWPLLVIAAIVLIGIMTNVTAVYRMIYVMNELDNREKKSQDSLPQILSQLTTLEGRKNLLSKTRYGYDRTKSQFRLAILLMIDGATPDLLKKLLQEGRLPNLARRFQEKGKFSDAVTVFPSATGPAFTPFITGCFPGTCNVPGIRWFDRSIPANKIITTKRFRDYFGLGAYAFDFDLSKNVKTIFEYSKQAYNLLGMLNRGSGISRDPGFLAAPYLFYQAKKNNIEAVEEAVFRWFVSCLKREPDFIFYYFPSIDSLTHEKIAAYQRLDDYVAKMEQALKEHGLLDETLWILSSDHGHHDVSKHFDLEDFLEKRFQTLYYPKGFKGWANAQALNMVTGNSMSHLYLKTGENWGRWQFIEDIEKSGLTHALLDRPEVDILLGRSREGGIQAISKKGRARMVEDQDGRISYQILGSDPFGFGPLPKVFDAEEALRTTYDSNYPDAIVQSLQIFRSSRCGDLVLSASLGSDLSQHFENPPHQSGHGSLRQEHMRIPFALSPALDLKTAPYRSADIFATTLQLIGIEPEHRLDGISLLAQKEETTRAQSLLG